MERFYTRKYIKKDGTISEYKVKYIPTGTKRTGRPKSINTKIRDIIDMMSLKSKEKLLKQLEDYKDKQDTKV